MTDPEITALAREYAEDATKTMVSDPNLSDTDINEIKRDVSEYAEEILRFLLRRFCLVEKSKVEDVYQRAKNTERDGEDLKLPLLCRTGRVQRILLESLFPSLGKEVEG